jgi:hypothetical protein
LGDLPVVDASKFRELVDRASCKPLELIVRTLDLDAHSARGVANESMKAKLGG